ncbi:MAG: 50S ribosomal protein L21 [bacterium]|nr:50S ribosomal protein L21 [bacterium]MDZ4247792.1 50S ribosomal protein L21 [Patescibacteria group bacterium]
MAQSTQSAKHAIIQTGGKQYRVSEGDELVVEKLESKKLTFPALAVVDGGALGEKKATVHAEALGDEKGPKLVVFKMKPKKRSRVKAGHRQSGTRIRITKIG